MNEETTETSQFTNLAPGKQSFIIDASIEEFSRRCFRAASLNKIVENAGISKGSIFNYFKTKNRLFEYIYRLAFNEIKEYLRTVRNETESDEFFTRLARIMEVGVEFIKIHPRLARIYFRIQNTGDAPDSNEIIQELHREAMRFIESIVESGITRGELRSDLNVPTVTFIIESILNRFLQAHYLNVLDPSFQLSPEVSPQWIQEFIKTLKQGLSTGLPE